MLTPGVKYVKPGHTWLEPPKLMEFNPEKEQFLWSDGQWREPEAFLTADKHQTFYSRDDAVWACLKFPCGQMYVTVQIAQWIPENRLAMN